VAVEKSRKLRARHLRRAHFREVLFCFSSPRNSSCFVFIFLTSSS
jgi:hypothetical protein